MNLSEALDAALPEIPKTRLARSRPPCLDPDLIVREDILDGEPIVGVLQRDKGKLLPLHARAMADCAALRRRSVL